MSGRCKKYEVRRHRCYHTIILAQVMDGVSPQSKQHFWLVLLTRLLSILKMTTKSGKVPHKLSSYSEVYKQQALDWSIKLRFLCYKVKSQLCHRPPVKLQPVLVISLGLRYSTNSRTLVIKADLLSMGRQSVQSTRSFICCFPEPFPINLCFSLLSVTQILPRMMH